MNVVKESSDKLNPTDITADVVSAAPRRARSFKDYLALTIATCGVGYLPLAPGTWGSLLAVAAHYLVLVSVSAAPIDTLALVQPTTFFMGEVAAILVITMIGIVSASHAERVLGGKDPGKVVIDEVAGQMIALLPLGNTWNRPRAPWFVGAFILFRFFDIVKPYPARKMEALKGGLGIMADDLVAGAYAAIVVALIEAFHVFGSFN